MKQRSVITLWAVAVALGIAAYFVKFHRSSDHQLRTNLSPGEKIMSQLPMAELTTVTIKQGADITTLHRGEDNYWTVNERRGYPANHALLRNLLGSLGQLQVAQGYPCTSEHYGRFGVSTESNEVSDLGLRITLTQADGSELTDIYLGKYNGTRRGTVGRFVRLASDSSGVYAAGETFPGVYADPPAWLDPQFFNIENIQSVSVSAPSDPSFTPWQLKRPSVAPNAQFKLVGMTSHEVMKLTSTGAFRTIFAHTTFQDVLTQDEADQTAQPDSKLKRQALIQTFDGISYTITFWPQKVKPQPTPDPESPLPPVQAAYLLTVTVSAKLPKTRNNTKDESPEISVQKDQAFATYQQAIKTHLALTESYQGKIYQVGHTLLEPLQKLRKDFVSSNPRRAVPVKPATPIAPDASPTP